MYQFKQTTATAFTDCFSKQSESGLQRDDTDFRLESGNPLLQSDPNQIGNALPPACEAPSAWQRSQCFSTDYPVWSPFSGYLQLGRSISGLGQPHQPAVENVRSRQPQYANTLDFSKCQPSSVHHESLSLKSSSGTRSKQLRFLPSQPYVNSSGFPDSFGCMGEEGTNQSFPTGCNNLASCESRFQVALLTSTAMVKEGEIPISYLNKRQIYTIAIHDIQSGSPLGIAATYRTYIRVCFDEAKQRTDPTQYWQFWKEGRDTGNPQRHGRKLQAIEHVPQPAATHCPKTSLHLEKVAIDGFCVTWTVTPGHPSYREVQFRCNFHSTDFGQSLGSKGTPMRLCVKNQVNGYANTMYQPATEPELSYCKIKLFRHGGAQRKLANDERAIQDTIKNLEESNSQPSSNEQIDGYSMTTGSVRKRRANDSYKLTRQLSKFAKYKNNSSESSGDSFHGWKSGNSGQLQQLASLRRLLNSKRDVTCFSLRGKELDDPDSHPGELPISLAHMQADVPREKWDSFGE